MRGLFGSLCQERARDAVAAAAAATGAAAITTANGQDRSCSRQVLPSSDTSTHQRNGQEDVHQQAPATERSTHCRCSLGTAGKPLLRGGRYEYRMHVRARLLAA